jgi:hypothetical protein
MKNLTPEDKSKIEFSIELWDVSAKVAHSPRMKVICQQAAESLRLKLKTGQSKTASTRKVKMKSLVTLLLATTLVLLPTAAQAQSQPPPVEQKSRLMGGVVLGILVIATGMIIITGLKKMCNKLPPPRGTNAPPEDISRHYPRINSPTNTGSSIVSLEQFDGSTWQETLTVEFDENANATVIVGRQIYTNFPCYTVPSTNGEYTVYYDLRSVKIEQKPFAFFRLSSP